MNWESLRGWLHGLISFVGVMGALLVVIGGAAVWVFPTYITLLALVIAAAIGDGFFYFVLRGVPWWMIRRDLRRLIESLLRDGFTPDVVIGTG